MPRKFSADVVAINVRLPKKLHKRLEQLAKRNSSSINTEMVARLERSIQTDNWPVDDLPLLLLQELAAIRGRMRLDNLAIRLRDGIATLEERRVSGARPES
jgi:Arc-like DNA binding domain